MSSNCKKCSVKSLTDYVLFNPYVPTLKKVKLIWKGRFSFVVLTVKIPIWYYTRIQNTHYLNKHKTTTLYAWPIEKRRPSQSCTYTAWDLQALQGWRPGSQHIPHTHKVLIYRINNPNGVTSCLMPNRTNPGFKLLSGYYKQSVTGLCNPSTTITNERLFTSWFDNHQIRHPMQTIITHRVDGHQLSQWKLCFQIGLVIIKPCNQWKQCLHTGLVIMKLFNQWKQCLHTGLLIMVSPFMAAKL